MPEARLAEIVGGLSLACDIVNAFPPGKVLRTTLLSVELALRAGEPDDVVSDTFWVSTLYYLGSTCFAHEEGSLYGAGDDHSVRNVMMLGDIADPLGTILAMFRGVAPSASLGRRLGAVGRLMNPAILDDYAKARCDTTVQLAEIIGASPRVVAALRQACERWDGRGAPEHLDGEALAAPIRILHFAHAIEIAHHRWGREAAVELARKRSGGQCDPELTQVFLRAQADVFSVLEDPRQFERFLDCEPKPVAVADEDRIDDVARAFAHFSDLKSVYFLGHSTGVAELARRAAAELGFDPNEIRTLSRAGLLHDLGRLSVPNGIWDRSGPLAWGEWEQVRMHTYYTERILAQAAVLRPVAAIASLAHERLDGGGYHRAADGATLSRSARVLAAPDAAHSMTEDRPHRPARERAAVARELGAEVSAGRLDRLTLDAVLSVLGAPERASRPAPRGLTEREVEVLLLVARGKTNRQIAAYLGISPKTVQHHVAHIYGKAGIRSRAGVAVWAMEQRLAP